MDSRVIAQINQTNILQGNTENQREKDLKSYQQNADYLLQTITALKGKVYQPSGPQPHLAADFNVDRTNEFKKQIEWRTQRLNLYHQQALQQQYLNNWNQVQQSNYCHQQQLQQQDFLDAQIQEEKRLIGAYQSNIQKNIDRLQQASDVNKGRADYYQYYQQKIDTQNQLLDSQLGNLDAEQKELAQKEWQVQMLKIENDIQKQYLDQQSQIGNNQTPSQNPQDQKGPSRFKGPVKQPPPTMDMTLPEHLAASFVGQPMPQKSKLSQSVIGQYHGKISKPWETSNVGVSNGQENPFQNQRAREKWRRFMAKEGKSTDFDGQLNNPSLGGYKRLDTYQRIYGKDKELPDIGNDDDLNDREGVFVTPNKFDGLSILAGAGAQQFQTSLKKKKTLRFADSDEIIGGSQTPYQNPYQSIQAESKPLDTYKIYADDPSNPYSDLTKSRGNSLGLSQSAKVFDTFIRKNSQQPSQQPMREIDHEYQGPVKKLDSYMDWLATKQSQQTKKLDKFDTKMQTSFTQQLIVADDKKTEKQNNWSEKKSVTLKKLLNF